MLKYLLLVSVYVNLACVNLNSSFTFNAARATIMNFFRIPLNLIVVIILTQVILFHVLQQTIDTNIDKDKPSSATCHPQIQLFRWNVKKKLKSVLFKFQNVPMDVIFKCCVVFLLLATASQQWLYRYVIIMDTNKHRTAAFLSAFNLH